MRVWRTELRNRRTRSSLGIWSGEMLEVSHSSMVRVQLPGEVVLRIRTSMDCRTLVMMVLMWMPKALRYQWLLRLH